MCPETYHLWVIKGPKKTEVIQISCNKQIKYLGSSQQSHKDPTLQYFGPLQQGTTMTTEGQEDELYFHS
jgi:hypothetical protein